MDKSHQKEALSRRSKLHPNPLIPQMKNTPQEVQWPGKFSIQQFLHQAKQSLTFVQSKHLCDLPSFILFKYPIKLNLFHGQFTIKLDFFPKS